MIKYEIYVKFIWYFILNNAKTFQIVINIMVGCQVQVKCTHIHTENTIFFHFILLHSYRSVCRKMLVKGRNNIKKFFKRLTFLFRWHRFMWIFRNSKRTHEIFSLSHNFNTHREFELGISQGYQPGSMFPRQAVKLCKECTRQCKVMSPSTGHRSFHWEVAEEFNVELYFIPNNWKPDKLMIIYLKSAS